MDEEDIILWSERYDESYDESIIGIEIELNEALPVQRYINRDQLEDVIRWKLNGQPGRRNRNLDMIHEVSDAFVRKVSEASFLVDNPVYQLKTLRSIPGIGDATATVILAFYDPEQYAVGDRFMMDALFGEDRQMRVTDYPGFLDELRERNPGDFGLRKVEKAYYQRYREEHDIGRW